VAEVAALDQALQIVGALLILTAYAGSQAGLLDQRGYPFLALNIVGSAILAWLAARGQQWGFLLLEGVWALVSIWSLLMRLRLREPKEPEAPR
jgi:hypothetical protein